MQPAFSWPSDLPWGLGFCLISHSFYLWGFFIFFFFSSSHPEAAQVLHTVLALFACRDWRDRICCTNGLPCFISVLIILWHWWEQLSLSCLDTFCQEGNGCRSTLVWLCLCSTFGCLWGANPEQAGSSHWLQGTVIHLSGSWCHSCLSQAQKVTTAECKTALYWINRILSLWFWNLMVVHLRVAALLVSPALHGACRPCALLCHWSLAGAFASLGRGETALYLFSRFERKDRKIP